MKVLKLLKVQKHRLAAVDRLVSTSSSENTFTQSRSDR
jgi:hypothetical protein